jgi:hypothetical protein
MGEWSLPGSRRCVRYQERSRAVEFAIGWPEAADRQARRIGQEPLVGEPSRAQACGSVIVSAASRSFGPHNPEQDGRHPCLPSITREKQGRQTIPMDIRKLSLRSLVFAAAAAVPVVAAGAAMACVPPPVGHGATAVLTAYHPAPKCQPFAPKDKFFYGPNKPGHDWCITWCVPKEYGRWVHKGPKKWEWVVTVDRGKHSGPVCKPGGKNPRPPRGHRPPPPKGHQPPPRGHRPPPRTGGFPPPNIGAPPTGRPTGRPTGQPTGRPTGLPTGRPTGLPTGLPG